MHESNHNSTLATKYCKNGCGFFGRRETNDMCSKCYRETKSDEEITPVEQGHTNQKLLTIPKRGRDSTSSDQSDFETEKNTLSENVASTTEKQGDNIVQKSRQSNSDVSPITSETTSRSRSPTRRRCQTCSRRVGLTGYQCRCGGLYCGEHRYSDRHDCDFDYQSEGREIIRRNNPKVTSRKISKL